MDNYACSKEFLGEIFFAELIEKVQTITYIAMLFIHQGHQSGLTRFHYIIQYHIESSIFKFL